MFIPKGSLVVCTDQGRPGNRITVGRKYTVSRDYTGDGERGDELYITDDVDEDTYYFTERFDLTPFADKPTAATPAPALLVPAGEMITCVSDDGLKYIKKGQQYKVAVEYDGDGEIWVYSDRDAKTYSYLPSRFDLSSYQKSATPEPAPAPFVPTGDSIENAAPVPIDAERYIVSANYRNRSSAYRWLVRRENESIDKAIAYESVVMQDVKVQPSGAGERGFGCSIVMSCGLAVGFGQEDLPRLNLKFDLNGFYPVGHDRRYGEESTHTAFSAVSLGSGGQIIAQ